MPSTKSKNDAEINIPLDADTQDLAEQKAGLSSYRRIFTFTNRIGWILNGVAFGAAIAAGSLLPLMNLVFGKAVTSLTDYASGDTDPQEFQAQAAKWSLYFVYLFIARFCMTYIWTVSLNVSALRTTTAIRTTFLRQALRQDIAFYDKSTNAAIADKVVTNGNLINVGIAEKLGLVVQGLAAFIASFVVVCNSILDRITI